jgi:hypothetical protein
MLVLIFMIAALGSYSLGAAEALRQEEFFVLSDDPNMVVIRFWGDRAVLSPLDPSSGKLRNSFMVIRLGDDPSLLFMPRVLGPLAWKHGG